MLICECGGEWDARTWNCFEMTLKYEATLNSVIRKVVAVDDDDDCNYDSNYGNDSVNIITQRLHGLLDKWTTQLPEWAGLKLFLQSVKVRFAFSKVRYFGWRCIRLQRKFGVRNFMMKVLRRVCYVMLCCVMLKLCRSWMNTYAGKW